MRDPEIIRQRFQAFVAEHLHDTSAGFTLGQRAWVAEFSTLLVEEVLKAAVSSPPPSPVPEERICVACSFGRHEYCFGGSCACIHSLASPPPSASQRLEKEDHARVVARLTATIETLTNSDEQAALIAGLADIKAGRIVPLPSAAPSATQLQNQIRPLICDPEHYPGDERYAGSQSHARVESLDAGAAPQGSTASDLEPSPSLKECSCLGYCRGRGGLSSRYLCALEQKPGKVLTPSPSLPSGRKEPHQNDVGDWVCEHGTAMDVHCCNCHSGFLFDSSACVCRDGE